MVLCTKQLGHQFRIVSSIYLQNIKVGQQTEQELLANFNDYSNGKLLLYTPCMWRFCALMAFWKGFLSGWWSRYTRLCTWAEHLHWDFSAHYLLLLLRWGGSSYRRALFSSLRSGIDSGLFVVNLVNLKSVDVLFCCITHCTNCIIYLKEIQTKNV